MGGLGQSILGAFVALLAAVGVVGVIYAIHGARQSKKQQRYFEDLHSRMAAGQHVVFSGGLHGTLVRVGKETCDVKVKSGAVVEVSRYAIQSIADGGKKNAAPAKEAGAAKKPESGKARA